MNKIHCLGERWQWIKLPLTWTPTGQKTFTMGTTGFVMSGAVTFDHRDIHNRRCHFFFFISMLFIQIISRIFDKTHFIKITLSLIWIKFRQVLENNLSPSPSSLTTYFMDAPCPHRSSGNGDLASCNEWHSLDTSHGHSDPNGGYHYHAVNKIISYKSCSELFLLECNAQHAYLGGHRVIIWKKYKIYKTKLGTIQIYSISCAYFINLN